MANLGVLTQGNYAGTDQGVDFRGAGRIPALDDATVTGVRRVSIIEGGSYPLVAYRLSSGPYTGRYVYVMENFTPSVKVGDKLKKGQSVGTAKGAYPYIEVGFASDASGNPAAPLYPNPHGAKPEGSLMWSYIQALGSGGGTGAGSGSLPGGSGATSGAPAGQPVGLGLGSLFGDPLGTSEALGLRFVIGLAGIALVIVALVLLSKATSSRTVALAAGLATGGKAGRLPRPGRTAPRAPRAPTAGRRRTVGVDVDEASEARAARRARVEASSGPSDEIPF